MGILVVMDFYEALIAANVPEDKAKKATEALSENFVTKESIQKNENTSQEILERTKGIEAHIKEIEAQNISTDKHLAVLTTELDIVKKLMWVLIAGIIAIVLKTYLML